ncbi:MAG: hypothetical protein E6Q97_31140 [Desulfurellales bacterium]|nr:MAG: hypothetical protein E6Q97_31140 [Desulfurellales bacterium]
MPAEVRSDIDLVTAAFRRLNLIPDDAEASGPEADDALALWAELHAELADDELLSFPSAEIPIEVFRACAFLLADILAPSKGRKPFADPDSTDHPSRQRLLRHMATRDAGEVMEISEF